ncbi:FUSC family protein [Actinopolyspora mortivallis]|uniref:FUSC family protein n=1 Tax=Actinopolyspora mortivallis TaxID=33906 RepID=UPI00037DC71D|nr:FUSC family protein [Actinopolyspora mortivallis]
MWGEWWNRFVASDPALRRLRTAVRVSCSVALTLLVLLPVLPLLGQSPSNALIGAVVAIQSSVAVNDTTQRQRLVTTLLMPIPATASLAVATVSQPLPALKVALFLVVIFVATYIRRFGARYFALGFVGFFGYFFAMFLRPTLEQIPAMALSAVCGALAACLLRFVLLRDDPQGVLERGRRTMRAHVHSLLHAVRELAENPNSVRHRRALQTHSVRLNETALMLEGVLEQLPGLDERRRALLRQRLLEVELAAENLLTPLTRSFDDPENNGAVPALAPLLDVLRTDPAEFRSVSRRVAEDFERQGSVELAMTVRRLGSAMTELAQATSELGEDGAEEVDEEPPPARQQETDQQERVDQDTGLRRPEVRVAAQATCAAALAIVGGQFVSPNRWYWAVITAFVVFISVNSRGELLVRAWQRTAGTVFGVLAGILVASQVTGHPVTELVLVLCCLFLAFYFLGYSYSALTFFVTTTLGILYGILGTFSASVLGTRLVETAVGAAAGVLAAVLVLPTSTRTVVSARSREFLLTLRDLLRRAGDETAHQGTVTAFHEDARELDGKLQQLRTSARPLTGALFRSRGSRLQRELIVGTGCAYYVRNLAVLLEHTVEMTDEDTRHRLAEALWALAACAEALTDEGDRPFGETSRALRPCLESLHDIAEALPTGPTSLHRTINLLDRIGQTLHDLAHEFGRVPRRESGTTAAG